MIQSLGDRIFQPCAELGDQLRDGGLEAAPERGDRAALQHRALHAGGDRAVVAEAEEGPGLAGWRDSIGERSNHSNLCTPEFRQNSVRIQESFSQCFRNSETFQRSQRLLECSA